MVAKYADDLQEEFPLGWLRQPFPPDPFFKFWIGKRSADLLNDFLDWWEELLGVLPALILANVALSEFELDPKLKQRVMTLDQVALFPVRILLDLGIREIVQGGAPRAFQIQQRGKKLEDLWAFYKSGSLGKLRSFLFGSLWSRIVKVFFLLMKWGKTFAYVVLLYRYLELLEDRANWSLLFNTTLNDQNKRKNERTMLRRRLGGAQARTPR